MEAAKQLIASIKSLPEPEQRVFFDNFAHDEYLVNQVLSLIENEADAQDVQAALNEYKTTGSSESWNKVKTRNKLQ